MDKTVMYTVNSSSPKLLILDNSGKVQTVNLKKRNLIGRVCEKPETDICLHSRLVSKKHGELYYQEGNWFYKDLESKNGTYINGVLFSRETELGKQDVMLQNGDVLRVDFGSRSEHHSEAVTMVFVLDCSEKLVWKEQILSENMTELTVGRSENNISVNNSMVSKKHAVFFQAHRGWAIMDAHSTNGVFLNGIRIDNPKYLFPYDVIKIANLYFFFTGDKILYPIGENGAETSNVKAKECLTNDGERLVIQIDERSVWQRFKKQTLLQNASLTINDGEMAMILGGSGAGKTTFMNAVMGYEKAKGSIRHGDTDIYKEYEKMKYEIGYVPQQDLLRGNDTVYNTLRDAADMKMLKKTGKAEKEKRVKEVIEMMGLQQEMNSLVSKLSGGQRKRLSVAVELIGNPKLFFLDEADSGVDGANTKELMKNLRAIADSGKIVMVITHTPDRVSEYFDKIIVLAKSIKDNSGHLAFFGTVEETLQFFDTETLEGVVKRINRTDESGEGKSDYYIEKYEKMTKEK